MRPSDRQLVGILACPRTEGLLVDDEHRRTELCDQIIGAASSDDERPVVSERAARGEERQQAGHY